MHKRLSIRRRASSTATETGAVRREDLNQENKRLVWRFWKLLENASLTEMDTIARRHLQTECLWHGLDPINQLQGADAFIEFD